MSAIYALKLADQIYILTDGAVYDDDGVVRGIQRKVWIADQVPLAVTGNGDWAALKDYAPAVASDPSFASIIAGLEATACMLRAVYAAEGDTGAKIGLLLGFHDGEKPRLVYASFNDLDPRFSPFTLTEIEAEFSATPEISEANQPVFAELLKDIGTLQGDFFDRRGADLFELLRQESTVPPGRTDRQYLVGGHVDLTIINRQGARTRRLRSWPDTIGERIRPSPRIAVQLSAVSLGSIEPSAHAAQPETKGRQASEPGHPCTERQVYEHVA